MMVDFQASSKYSNQALSFFDQKPRLLVATLVLLFLAALAIRVYNLEAPGILPEREFRSMVIARANYYEHTDRKSVV